MLFPTEGLDGLSTGVGDPRIGFDVRIAACVPPPAALLLLTSVAGPNGAGGGQG